MKNKLFTLAAALTLAAVISGIYAAPALAAVIKAVLIKNVDEPGRSPYSVRIDCFIGAGGYCFKTTPDGIPDGTRFVVEYVSVQVMTTSPTGIAEVSIGGEGGDKSTIHLELSGNQGSEYSYSANGPVRAFYEPGQKPGVSIATYGGSINSHTIITGYLVDLHI